MRAIEMYGRTLKIDPTGPRWALFWIGLGWALSLYGILGLLNGHPIVKTELILRTNMWLIWPPLAAGSALMVLGFRLLPRKGSPDLTRKAAWTWLAVILSAGALLRLYHLGQPPGPFWDDWATTLVWVHNILDKNKFYWMLPSDGIEPFNTYVITALRCILPDEVRYLEVRRLASCLVDMFALWTLYLAGKELVSRRAGLIAAALGALGRPMIQLSVTGMRAYSLSLAVGFLVVASLKLFRKPSLGHFLLWALALAFGAHTYSSFRVFILVLPFLLLPWVFRDREKIPPIAWAAPFPAILLLLGVFSGTLAGTDPHFNGWHQYWTDWSGRPWIMTGLFLLGLLPGLLATLLPKRRLFPFRLAGWSLAVGAASLMIFPLTLSPEFDGRLAVLSPFKDPHTAQNLWGFLGGQLWQTLRSLFYWCLDRNDLTIGTDPFLDLFSQGALVLGVAFLIARPDWKKIFLVTMSVLGLVVYVISLDPASTKLTAFAPPIYLLSAWAVASLWSAFPKPARDRRAWGPFLLSLFLVGYAIFGFWIQKEKIFGYWANIPMADTELAKRVALDEPRFRVYLVPGPWFFGMNSQFILNEGRRYYILKGTNAIPVREGDPPTDVVLYVYGTDPDHIRLLHDRFPGAAWQKIFVYPHREGDPNTDLYMWRVFVPGDQIPWDPKGLLHRVAQNGVWLRRFYDPLYGWGLGEIVKEERVDTFDRSIDVYALMTPEFHKFNDGRLVQSLGDLTVDRAGRYQWSIRFSFPIWIKIDGKTVWKKDTATAQELFTFETDLDKGVHHLDIRTRFQGSYALPVIDWKQIDGPIEMPLEGL